MSTRGRETYGRRLFTWRVTAVPETGTDLIIPIGVREIKGITIHREGNTLDHTVLGNVDFTDRAAARITSDGKSVDYPLNAFEGCTVMTLAAPTGETCDFSILAWG